MPKILVCQHVPYEPLGLLDPILRDAGFRIRYANFGRHPHLEPSLAGYDGLVVLGGPMNVDETDRFPHLAREMELLREAVRREIPTLGICLGAQLLAKALGGDVGPSPEREIGWYPLRMTQAAHGDALLGHFGAHETVFQWHAYAFTPPPGAVHLAGGGAGCRHQAFRVSERAYGFQFHLEADTALIERWLSVPAHKRELEQYGLPAPTAAQTAQHIDRSIALGGMAFTKFVELFAPRRRLVPLRLR
jgi:GMP synthase (glutamine-hydrolysing)